QHRVQRALLVEHALALDRGVRAQNHLVPVAGYVLELPQSGCDRFVAHLLGYGDVVGLDLAVGMVGAAADEDAALPADQHEFDFAGGLAAAAFDAVFHGQPPRRGAIVDRRRGWPGDAHGLEFGDVLVPRDRVAAGPAGDD